MLKTTIKNLESELLNKEFELFEIETIVINNSNIKDIDPIETVEDEQELTITAYTKQDNIINLYLKENVNNNNITYTVDAITC